MPSLRGNLATYTLNSCDWSSHARPQFGVRVNCRLTTAPLLSISSKVIPCVLSVPRGKNKFPLLIENLWQGLLTLAAVFVFSNLNEPQRTRGTQGGGLFTIGMQLYRTPRILFPRLTAVRGYTKTNTPDSSSVLPIPAVAAQVLLPVS